VLSAQPQKPQLMGSCAGQNYQYGGLGEPHKALATSDTHTKSSALHLNFSAGFKCAGHFHRPDSLFATTLGATVGHLSTSSTGSSVGDLCYLEVCYPVSACQSCLCTHRNLIQILEKWYLTVKKANIQPPHFAVSKSGLSSQTSPSEASLGLSCAVSLAPKAPLFRNLILCRAGLLIRWSW